jgi:hypothetical protein
MRGYKVSMLTCSTDAAVGRIPKAVPVALMLVLCLSTAPVAMADEAQARDLVKAMSDYVGAQTAISFDYDSDLEIVTNEQQKLSFVSSGAVTIIGPTRFARHVLAASPTSKWSSTVRSLPSWERTPISTDR